MELAWAPITHRGSNTFPTEPLFMTGPPVALYLFIFFNDPGMHLAKNHQRTLIAVVEIACLRATHRFEGEGAKPLWTQSSLENLKHTGRS